MRIGRTAALCLAMVFLSVAVFGLPPFSATNDIYQVAGGVKAGQKLDNTTLINVNNIEMFVTNHGSFSSDLGGYFGKTDGLYFPSGTDKTVLYASGVWVGGKVNDANPATDEIRLVIGGHTTEYHPGPADGPGGSRLPDSPEYKVYKIARDSSLWLKSVKSDYELLDSIEHFNDYQNWPSGMGAPLDTSGNPLVIGDQNLWAVYNDGGPHDFDSYGGGTDSLGVEIQQYTWGYDLPGALGNAVFMRYVIINKGDDTIDSCYISLWSDPDLGGASDDLVGCDTATSLGYCFNATNADATYGATPPAVGFDFLQGPIIYEGDPIFSDTDFTAKQVILNTGDTIDNAFMLGMSSFNKYINGTDPNTPDEGYNYMKGLTAAGDPLLDPNGVQTKYFGAGNPVAGTGWVDTDPADRRWMQTTGPFTFYPNDTQIVVAAVLVGQAGDRLQSIDALKFFDELVQFAYDVNFDIPLPPPRPVVKSEALDEKVVLTWGNRSETDYDEEFHDFEGYIVYQGATVAGPWTVVKTLDIENGFGALNDFALNPDLGAVVYQPVVNATDEGVGYGIEITEDKILGGKLHNGQTYYFAVTAYSYDFQDNQDYLENRNRADSLFNVPKGFWFLENGIQAIRVTPQDDMPGTDWESSQASVSQSRVNEALSPGTDQIVAEIIDPTAVNGHTYQIRFTAIEPDTFIDTTVTGFDTTFDSIIVTADDSAIAQISPSNDTTWAYQYWELWDMTDNKKILPFQTNRSGDENYQVVDGIRFKVLGAHKPAFQSVNYLNNNDAHRRALTGVNWGGGFFFGGVDIGYNFWGGYIEPSMTDSFTTIEIRFVQDVPLTEPPRGQRAYNYCRGCVPNYGYQGYFRTPFEAWDATNNRQVNVAYVEYNASNVYDSTWNPDVAAELGGREYLLPLRSTYDGDDEADAGTGDIDYTTEDFLDGSTFDFLYGAWVGRRAASDVIDSGDVFQFLYANPADTNDIYTIQTTAATTDNANLAQNALPSIRVVPNPYYGYSAYETNQFDRQVRILGVPEQFTMRIFNLAGDKVRTITHEDKDSPDYSWVRWDLKTDQGLYVAGGIYIFYLEMPGVGTTFGKMAVFPEAEQLNTY